jgi:hypothetical protein
MGKDAIPDVVGGGELAASLASLLLKNIMLKRLCDANPIEIKVAFNESPPSGLK